MVEVLNRIRAGKSVEVPHYCFVQHKRIPNMSTRYYGAGVVIFEGIMTLHHAKVLELLHLKLFVDTDADIRLARRLKVTLNRFLKLIEQTFFSVIYKNAGVSWKMCSTSTRSMSNRATQSSLGRQLKTPTL